MSQLHSYSIIGINTILDFITFIKLLAEATICWWFWINKIDDNLRSSWRWPFNKLILFVISIMITLFIVTAFICWAILISWFVFNTLVQYSSNCFFPYFLFNFLVNNNFFSFFSDIFIYCVKQWLTCIFIHYFKYFMIKIYNFARL